MKHLKISIIKVNKITNKYEFIIIKLNIKETFHFDCKTVEEKYAYISIFQLLKLQKFPSILKVT